MLGYARLCHPRCSRRLVPGTNQASRVKLIRVPRMVCRSRLCRSAKPLCHMCIQKIHVHKEEKQPSLLSFAYHSLSHVHDLYAKAEAEALCKANTILFACVLVKWAQEERSLALAAMKKLEKVLNFSKAAEAALEVEVGLHSGTARSFMIICGNRDDPIADVHARVRGMAGYSAAMLKKPELLKSCSSRIHDRQGNSGNQF